MKKTLLLVSLLFSYSIFAQIADDFSDGDFHSYPQWSGDTSKFMVNNNFQLQANNGAVADEIYLSTPAPITDSTVWEFYVKMTFSPSATNFMKIYLMADQSDLKKPLNGYFIKIGENGSNDAINLFEQSGTTEKLIAGGIKGRAAVNPLFRIKVLRDNSGNWVIQSDSTGGTGYILEGTGFSDKFKSGTFFGIVCKHTSTNAKKFFFDDLFIAPIYTDTTPPNIVVVNILDKNKLEVIFSEKVEIISAESASNYKLLPQNAEALSAQLDIFDPKKVTVQFQYDLLNKTNHTLTIKNISDEAGNILLVDSIGFFYFIPQPKDILINEIMADPSPPVDLPDAEYVELYNNTIFDINLKGWKFSDAASTVVLPDVIIPADSFAIIVSSANAALFSGYGIIIAVPSLPTLNNSSDELTLVDPDGNIIHQVNYSDKWYGDNTKKVGGWSLELIEANNSCEESSNWTASYDPSGGTPGRRNSVIHLKDTSTIAVKTIIAGTDSVVITFSRSIKEILALDKNNYHIEKGIGSPVAVISSLDKKQITLKLDRQLQAGEKYELFMKNILDCKGNSIDPAQPHIFYLPEKATFFDIVINEIMADPDPAVGLPAVEYVELYNRSNKSISLENWKFSDNSRHAKIGAVTLGPKEYLILTAAGKEELFSSYGRTVGLTSWPALNNSEDSINLSDDEGNIIHFVNYSDSWYGNRIKKDGGWSLEMIDPENPCGAEGNWSASKDVKGGTPGKVNSIYRANPDKKLPEAIHAFALDDNNVVVIFNEALDPASLLPAHFHIKKGLGNPETVGIFNNELHKVVLHFEQKLQQKEIYELEIKGATDCAGNLIGTKNIVSFGIAEAPVARDIIINEILYNPSKGGVDFVEIYNNSDKAVDLSTLYIARTTSEAEVTDFTLVSAVPFLILPGQYFALTSNPSNINKQYLTADPERIFRVPKLPNYPDDEGGVAILDKQTDLIDFVFYSKSWQHPFIDDHNGISLERISFTGESNDKNNWHSAATHVMATPGYKNSQTGASINASTSKFSVEPEAFSPDGDGYNDHLNIHYQFTEPGNIVSVAIYDHKGTFIRQLIKNEMLEQQGSLIWDGAKQDRQKAGIGIYIIHLEGYNQNGQTFHSKMRCVLGGAL